MSRRWSIGSRFLSQCIIAAIAILIATGSRASDADDCGATDTESSVAACTRLIDAGKDKGPALASLYYKRGTILTNLGKHTEAIADLTRAIELRKDFANAFYNRGLAYWRMDDFPRSIADFTAYMRLDPKAPETYRVRGRAYRGNGEPDRAIADLNEYVRRKPDDAQGYQERGLAYQDKGDFPKAIAEFERMIKIDPKSDAAYSAIGKALSDQNQDKQAIAKYDEAIRIAPNNADHYIARAEVHAKLQDMDSAIADYQRALRADPSSGRAAGLVGWALSQKGNNADAVEYFSQAIRLEPEGPDHYNNRGWSLYRLSSYTRAKADFDRALELKPDHELALFNRAVNFVELEQFDAAIADFDALERINPKAADLLFQRGWAKFFKGNLDAALADFQKAADADADDSEAQNGLCWVLAHQDQFDKATPHCDKSVSLAPNSAGALHTRGIAKMRMGVHALALADFDRAIEIEPKNAGLYADRGRIHEARGDRARALADYQKALTLPAEGYYYVQAKNQAIVRLSELANAPAQVAIAVAPPPAAKPAAPEKRVALVIGNSAYKNVSALSNPKNDAGAVAASLRRVGFNNVIEKYDLSRQELTQALQAFGDTAEDADWAVIYYAGHGIEIGGVNYVIPVDAALKASNHVDDEALSLDRVMSTVGSAKKMKLVILDACRDNPFVPKMRSVGAARSVGRGLGRIEPPPGVLVAYAARDGLVAMDGETGNSPFATALVEHMEESGVEINLLFRKVRDAVFRTTQGKQEPYTYGSLPAQQFFFKVQ